MKDDRGGCFQFWVSTTVARLHPQLAPDLAQAAERVPPMAPPLPDPTSPGARVAANLKALAMVNREATGSLFDLLAYSGWGGLGDEWARLPLALRDRISRDELIASYYTPHSLAFEMARVALLHLPRGAKRVLDPAAGSGRLLFPLAFSGLSLTGVEVQEATADVLERWGSVVTPQVEVHRGPFERIAPRLEPFDLVISNPPYGERPFREADPSYRRISRAHLYFLQRSTALLAEAGIGVFLMPDGFLSGSQARAERETWLATAELVEAWQLPANLFPGAKLNVTVLVFRRRTKPLGPIDEAVAAGQYFEIHPEHVQGEVRAGKGRWAGLREGVFVCLGPAATTPVGAVQHPEAVALERADALVRRVDRGLAWELDVADLQRAGVRHPELPRVEPRVPAPHRAERLWSRDFRPVRFEGLDADELAAAGWRPLAGGWVPPRLWGVLTDLVSILSTPEAPDWLRAELGERQKVPPAVVDTVSWKAPYLPLAVLTAWLRSTPQGEAAVVLRVDGVLAVRGHPWGTYLMAEINGDNELWPKKTDRIAVIAALDASWADFRARPQYRPAIVAAYARTFRAVLEVPHDPSPERLERWNLTYRTPHGYQWAEARRAAMVRRALTGFGVGLGKTLTAILTWLLLRNKGEARRTLVIVPSSTLPGWVSTWRGAVPDVGLQTIGDNDSKERRRQKWRAVKDFEVTVATRDAAKNLPVDRAAAVQIVIGDAALSKEVWGGSGGTERELAKAAATARAFLDDKLRHEDTEMPSLADLGVDHIIIDEAQSCANLYSPPAIDGEKTAIAYIGGSDQQSQRAWSLVLGIRSLAESGEVSIHALTATPAQNGPLDLYAVSALLGNPWPQKNPRSWLHDYARIERSLKERATGAVEMVAAVTGFAREPEFFAYLDYFARFATAESVNLKLPEVQAERILVPASSDELSVLLGLITQLANAAKKRQFSKIRAIYTKLNMAAVHWMLLEEKPPKHALPSSKMKAIMERVGKTCGHIVFVELVLAQRWLAEAMRDRGLTVEILNGEASIAERAKIRDRFNSGETDVVIVGGVGQEGVDLQVRTCTLHHMDLPWTPARLEQRNGRGVRQGNDTKVVGIFYYLLTPSADSLRLQVVIGKGNALAQLVQKKATNNPAAESDLPLAAILREASMHAEAFDVMLKSIEEDQAGTERLRQEEERRAAVRAARQRVATGLDLAIADDVPVVYPSERVALLHPHAVELVDSEQRAWWAAPGDVVLVDGEFRALSWVEHEELGDLIVLRPLGSVDVKTYRRKDVILGEPAPSTPPEDEEELWRRAGGNERWALLPPELVTRLWSRGAPPPKEGSRARPRLRDGRLVSEGDGVVVPPTDEGWRQASASDYAVSRWFLEEGWSMWWPRPLPSKPTREERLIFESRRAGEASEAAFDAVFKARPASSWKTLIDASAALHLPYGVAGGYREGTKLPGPGILESSDPTHDVDPHLRFGDSIFRAAVARVSSPITAGVVADALQLPDGLWRPGIRDAAETDSWMWVGGDALLTADEAQQVAREAHRVADQRIDAGRRIDAQIQPRLAIAALARDLYVDAMVVGVVDETVYLARGYAGRLNGRVIGRAAGPDVHHGATATGLAELFADNEGAIRAEVMQISERNPGVITFGARSLRSSKPPFPIGRTLARIDLKGREAVEWLTQSWDRLVIQPGRIEAHKTSRGLRATWPVVYDGPTVSLDDKSLALGGRHELTPEALTLHVHEPRDEVIAVSVRVPFWVGAGTKREPVAEPQVQWIDQIDHETVGALREFLAGTEFATFVGDGRGVRVLKTVGKRPEPADKETESGSAYALPMRAKHEPFRRVLMAAAVRDRLATAEGPLMFGLFGTWGAALATSNLVTILGGYRE